MRDYVFDESGFWTVEIDDQGQIVGAPQAVPDADWGKAVAALVDGYAGGTLRFADSNGKLQISDKRVTDDDFYNNVIARAADEVDKRNLPEQQKTEVMHRLFGDNPNIVRLVASRDSELAERIWGSGRVQKYTQNDTDPSEPIPTPADVCQNVESGQGKIGRASCRERV